MSLVEATKVALSRCEYICSSKFCIEILAMLLSQHRYAESLSFGRVLLLQCHVPVKLVHFLINASQPSPIFTELAAEF